jgi:four helix bundle protein
MTPELSQASELRNRTKAFALRLVRLFQALPRTEEARIIGRQMLRSGTSVAANYRACQRARSRAEFAAKMGIVLEEADETVFWLELLVESSIVPAGQLQALLREARELVAIFYSSRRSAVRACQRPSAPNSTKHQVAAQLSCDCEGKLSTLGPAPNPEAMQKGTHPENPASRAGDHPMAR